MNELYYDITVRPYQPMRSINFNNQRPVTCTVEIFTDEWRRITKNIAEKEKLFQWLETEIFPAVKRSYKIEIIKR